MILGRLLTFLLAALFPVIAFASEEGGSPVSGFLWRIFVFAIFAAILYKLLAKRIKSALATGAEDIQKTIVDAENACVAAEKELAEYVAKIDAMTRELEDMKSAARNTAEKEAENILADAETAAIKHKEQVKKTIDAELAKAVSSLRSEIALLAVEQAEKTLAARKDDAAGERYIKQSITKIGA